MAPVCVCVAMCDLNRGIAFENALPWPYLKHDADYYKALTQHPKDLKMKVANIRGRHTWTNAKENDKAAPAVVNVVISSKLRERSHPHLDKVVPSFHEAVEYLVNGPHKDDIETIWAMGGTRVYEEAIDHPRCSRIYLTRVFGSFEADTYFPKFENKFVRDPRMEAKSIEDNGVSYQFEVYKPTK